MKILLSLLISFSAHVFASTSYLDSFETDDCVISLLDDGKGGKLVLKQLKDESPDEQFLLVLDALGCYIAQQAMVPINRVEIIPASLPYIGKTKQNLPATLHTFVQGKSLEEDPFSEIDIHQRFPKKHNQRYGAIPQESIGLSKSVIQNMAKHPDLPRIAALDTFLGNADRSSPNLFYCKETDRFCGIDLAASFSSPLAKEALMQIQRLETAQEELSGEEKKALLEYGKALKRLAVDFPPGRQKKLLVKFAKAAGFEEGSPLWNQDTEDRMSFHCKCILSNYEHTQMLISSISELLKEF